MATSDGCPITVDLLTDRCASVGAGLCTAGHLLAIGKVVEPVAKNEWVKGCILVLVLEENSELCCVMVIANSEKRADNRFPGKVSSTRRTVGPRLACPEPGP